MDMGLSAETAPKANAYLKVVRYTSSLTYHAASWHLQLSGQGESVTTFSSFFSVQIWLQNRVQLAVLLWNTDQPVAQQLTKVE